MFDYIVADQPPQASREIWIPHSVPSKAGFHSTAGINLCLFAACDLCGKAKYRVNPRLKNLCLFV
jgi:hypothetical protein